MGKQLIYVVVLLYVVALKGQSKEVEDSLALNHSTEATRLDSYIKYDDTRETNWDNNYKLVGIKSSFDANVQKAYLFKSVSETPRPLIVSLHTWSGDYTQKDEIADLCRLKNIKLEAFSENWKPYALIGLCNIAIPFVLIEFANSINFSS